MCVNCGTDCLPLVGPLAGLTGPTGATGAAGASGSNGTSIVAGVYVPVLVSGGGAPADTLNVTLNVDATTGQLLTNGDAYRCIAFFTTEVSLDTSRRVSVFINATQVDGYNFPLLLNNANPYGQHKLIVEIIRTTDTNLFVSATVEYPNGTSSAIVRYDDIAVTSLTSNTFDLKLTATPGGASAGVTMVLANIEFLNRA